MRVLSLVVVLMLLPVAMAQTIPADQIVHHPLTIEAKMQEIRDINPDFIAMDSYGESELGFGLWALDVVHPDVRADGARMQDIEVFYLDANHHGNEQLGMEALLIFLEELAEWSLTEEGQDRLQEVRVVAAPMINPDGTGRNNRVNTNFVDLNRNYDYNWGLYGTSDTASPAGGTYRGEAALSEVESRANAQMMQNLKPRVYLSMHTGSHDIVLPWRNETGADGPMPDWPVYAQYLTGIEDVSGLGYRDPSGAGESISHAYGNLGTISLIVEVDNLQSQVVVADIPERLQEEVAIYWYTLEVFERIGGHLIANGTQVCNDGWGAAYNLTTWENAHDHRVTLLAAELAPGACLEVPAPEEARMFVDYFHTAQGAKAQPGANNFRPGTVHIAAYDVAANSTQEPLGEGAPALPIVVLSLGLVTLAVALRRRAA